MGGSVQDSCTAGAPAQEICDNALDDDCDGTADELADCQFCTAANTIAATDQTFRNVIRGPTRRFSGRVILKGRFVLPQVGAVDFPTDDITIQIRDGSGQIFYEATIPGGTMTTRWNGRLFLYKDASAPYEVSNLKRIRIALRRNRLVGRYFLRFQDLPIPDPQPGTGSVTVRFGGQCFEDTADLCTRNWPWAGVVCK